MSRGSLAWLATRWVTPDSVLSMLSVLADEGRSTDPARRAGKLPVDFSASHPRVSFLSAAEIWRYMIGACDDPALGIRTAEHSLRREPGLVDYLLRSSPSLATGLRVKARFAPVDDELRRCTFTEDGEFASFAFHGSAALYLPAAAEFVAARLVGLVRRFSDCGLNPQVVRFLHDAPRITSSHRAFFRSDLAYRADAFEVVYRLSDLTRASPSSDGGLYRLLLGYAEEKLATIVRPRGAAERIRELLIARWQPGGGAPPSRGEVAAALGVTTRTLSRRLEEDGRTFSDVVDESRALAAVRSLQRPDASISQVAHALGFRDQSAFTHAFRRWTGFTPGQYRRLYGSGHDAP